LAFGDEGLAAFEVAAGDGGDDAVAGVADAFQFFRAMFAGPRMPQRRGVIECGDNRY